MKTATSSGAMTHLEKLVTMKIAATAIKIRYETNSHHVGLK